MVEFLLGNHHVLLELLLVNTNQYLLQFIGIVGPCLPYKRCYIVIERAFPSALEVYEVRLAVFEHDVPGLEIAIHESAAPHHSKKVRAHLLHILMELYLAELQTTGLKETILEVVEVEPDVPLVKLRLRETY